MKHEFENGSMTRNRTFPMPRKLTGGGQCACLRRPRDATTVWFDVGERSLQFEAYVLPTPPHPLEVFRQALFRNASSWRAFFALDAEGAIVLRGRIAKSQVTHEELDRVLGEGLFDGRSCIQGDGACRLRGSRKVWLETCEHECVDKACGKPRFLLINPVTG